MLAVKFQINERGIVQLPTNSFHRLRPENEITIHYAIERIVGRVLCLQSNNNSDMYKFIAFMSVSYFKEPHMVHIQKGASVVQVKVHYLNSYFKTHVLRNGATHF